ncbi:Mis6-domain-containing protein [Morchella conica CCBAS932]|uniref:Mis6-domain-containing protein n=1 Tax=Morchella conica CCBAS932 TaxID=1392247 RepID=A0A3N4KZX1_9PEZI|nr:Mis6-domain-containing protein [Morchella conica CCBAS932]
MPSAATSHAASTRNSLSKSDITDAIEKLSQHASVRGLADDALENLIGILTKTPCYLDQSAISNIVKVLFPQRKVSEDVVIKIVGCFGQGQSKPSLATQALLLRWLVMVYDILESYTALSQLYGVLFNLLDMITLRSHLCHLLSLLTRRKHVKPFRIQALLEFKRNLGNEQPLNGLLQVFKDYYPDVIVGDIAPTKVGLFSHPNPEWMQKLLLIQESSAADYSGPSEASSFRIVRKVGGQGTKRQKTNHLALPEVHTFHATEASVTLEEVENVDDFVNKLDKLELPNQLVAALEDPLLRKLLQLKPSDAATSRINNWLAACLSDELRSSQTPTPGSADRTAKLLSKILEYTHSTKKLLPAVEGFLYQYLQSWDGKSHKEYILGLLSLLSLRGFEDSSTSSLINFYTELLHQWRVTYRNSEMLEVEGLALRKYMAHVSQICLAGQVAFPGSSFIPNAILCFYECASSLPWQNGLFRISLPPDQLVYIFLFAGDVMMLSRIAGILSKYKRAFELTLKKSSSDSGPEEYPREYVNHFNGFLMDICNLVWRNRAFKAGGPESKQDQNAHGCTLPENVISLLNKAADSREESLMTLFSLSHSAVLAQLSAECLRGMENAQPNIKARHSGPVTQKSLALLASNGGLVISWPDFRVAVLNSLGRGGLIGISNFMHSTMISLIQSSAAR